MFDIICIGDTALDVFLQIDEATVNCTLDTKMCQLCVNYSEKIPVKKVTEIAGVGSAANTAVATARLGLKPALYTILGDDFAGKESARILKKEKVSCAYIKIDKKQRTDYATVMNYKGERTILTYQGIRKYSLPKISKTKWFYMGALSDGHEILREQVIAKIKSENIKFAFNPGAKELRGGVGSLKSLLEVTTVLLLNREEAEKLIGKTDNIKSSLALLKDYGPEYVVITDGLAGSHCFDGEKFYFQDIFDLPVVERTGAGDAFASGFMSAMMYGLNIKEALRWGAANAASVVGKIGAQEGLLTKKQIMDFLKKNPFPKAEVV